MRFLFLFWNGQLAFCPSESLLGHISADWYGQAFKLLHHNDCTQKVLKWWFKEGEKFSFHSQNIKKKKSGNKSFKRSKPSFWRPGNDAEIDATPKPYAGYGSSRATAPLQHKEGKMVLLSESHWRPRSGCSSGTTMGPDIPPPLLQPPRGSQGHRIIKQLLSSTLKECRNHQEYKWVVQV